MRLGRTPIMADASAAPGMPAEIVDPSGARAAGAGAPVLEASPAALRTRHDADTASAPPVDIDVHAGDATAPGDGPFPLSDVPGPPLVREGDAPLASRRTQLVEGLLVLAGHAAALTALLTLGAPLPSAPETIEVTVVASGNLSPAGSLAAEPRREASANPEAPSPTPDTEAQAPPPPPKPAPETARHDAPAKETPPLPPLETPAPSDAPPTAVSEQTSSQPPKPAPPEEHPLAAEAQVTPPLPPPGTPAPQPDSAPPAIAEALETPPPPPAEPAPPQKPVAPAATLAPLPAPALARLADPASSRRAASRNCSAASARRATAAAKGGEQARTRYASEAAKAADPENERKPE